MRNHLILTFLCALAGILLWRIMPATWIWTPYLEYFQLLLLGIWLYGAVYGIDTTELRHQKGNVISIVTLGVAFKIFFIWWILYLITWDPIAWILWWVMGQIDPLSTAKLSTTNKITAKGKTFLNTRASFDDPMTVLIVFYLLVPVIFATQAGIGEYGTALLYNGLFVGVVYILHRLCSRSALFECILLLAAMIIGVYFWWMLGIAIIGLFLRPSLHILQKSFWGVVELTVKRAFALSVVLLGIYLTYGVTDLHVWVYLGAIVFVSQIVATTLFVRHLSVQDKNYLRFAQYNGITSIILATSLRKYDHRIIGYVAIAIVCITLVYAIASVALDRKYIDEWEKKYTY